MTRHKGEGSIVKRSRQRQDGSSYTYYQIQLRVDSERHTRYAPTMEQARAELAKLRAAATEGRRPATDRTLERYLEEWWPIAASQLSGRTIDTYRMWLQNHILPSLGHKRLGRLTGEDLARFYVERSSVLAPRSVGHLHRILHKALADAVQWGLIARNPADLAHPPRVPRAERPALTVEQARALLDAARGDPLELRPRQKPPTLARRL